MKENQKKFGKLILMFTGLLAAAPLAQSQPFAYQPNDLALGFRKTTPHQANYEMVVDIGPGVNYTTLAAGASTNVPNYSPAQLGTAFSNLTFLNWSVLGNPNTTLSGYPNKTIWLTVPRTNVNNQTAAPTRLGPSAQQAISINIQSIFDGAVYESGQSSSNANYNTTSLVREPINDPYNLSTFVGGMEDTTISTLQDSWVQNVENITPSTFSSAQRADFYELRPTGVTDPHTGLATGAGYYVGYFQLNTDGSMTFTRASASGTPPAPVLSVARAGTTTTISFGTTNGATYTLYYTNAAGLKNPVATWASAAGTISGNGLTNQFMDTTTDTNRVYRVGAH